MTSQIQSSPASMVLDCLAGIRLRARRLASRLQEAQDEVLIERRRTVGGVRMRIGHFPDGSPRYRARAAILAPIPPQMNPKNFISGFFATGCVIAASMLLPSVGFACHCASISIPVPIPGAGSAQNEKVRALMAALMEQTGKLGTPGIRGAYPVGGKSAPGLYFGLTRMNNIHDVVDALTKEHGGVAALFVKARGEYVRVATSVRNGDGSRPIGTILDPNSTAVVMLNRGVAYYGNANVLGQPFVIGYEPIWDCTKNVIGVYFVGARSPTSLPPESPSSLR